MKLKGQLTKKEIENLFKYRNALTNIIYKPNKSYLNFTKLNDLKQELNFITFTCDVIKQTSLYFHKNNQNRYYTVIDKENNNKTVGCYSDLALLSLDLMIEKGLAKRLVQIDYTDYRYAITKRKDRLTLEQIEAI